MILTEAFALVCCPIDVHLRADDVAEWHEHLSEFRITKFLRQVVDEQVAPLRTYDRQRANVYTSGSVW